MAKAIRGSDKFDVRIPSPLKDDMINLAESMGLNHSQFIREAIKLYVEKLKTEGGREGCAPQ